MKKRLISLTSRQDHILQEISEELGIPLSEVFRRILDAFIDNRLKEGDLIRFRVYVNGSFRNIELPEGRFNEILSFIKSHCKSIEIKETEA